MYLNGDPLFCFGHGLSYTEFNYSRLELSTDSVRQDGKLTVRVTVKNTGARAGEEVAQLYVHELEPAVKRPVRELHGFERISLSPGESKQVTFTPG